MKEYDTAILHTRPGSKRIWEDRAWFGAESENALSEVLKEYYAQWNFKVVCYTTHSMSYACNRIDENGWPR